MKLVMPKTQNEWVSRRELNWCSYCWFNAKIESRQTDIGTMWLCLNCGISIHAYPDGNGKGSLGEELPRYFSDEEWQKYWETHIKVKE